MDGLSQTPARSSTALVPSWGRGTRPILIVAAVHETSWLGASYMPIDLSNGQFSASVKRVALGLKGSKIHGRDKT